MRATESPDDNEWRTRCPYCDGELSSVVPSVTTEKEHKWCHICGYDTAVRPPIVIPRRDKQESAASG